MDEGEASFSMDSHIAIGVPSICVLNPTLL